jgi:hypothetical protein
MKFSFSSVDICQNFLVKLLLIINDPIMTILTPYEAEMELCDVLSMGLVGICSSQFLGLVNI